MGSYVGIDLHRQRSVIAVLNDDGDRVSWSRINNTPAALASELAAAGPDAEVPGCRAPRTRWGRRRSPRGACHFDGSHRTDSSARCDRAV
jgi:hypothetical protein